MAIGLTRPRRAGITRSSFYRMMPGEEALQRAQVEGKEKAGDWLRVWRPSDSEDLPTFREARQAWRQLFAVEALGVADGNKSQAARDVGVARSYFCTLLRGGRL